MEAIEEADYIRDKQHAEKDSNILHPESFSKDMKLYGDYAERTGVSVNCGNRSCVTDRRDATRQEAKLFMMINCVEFQDAFHKIFTRADNWGFYSAREDTKVLEDSRLQAVSGKVLYSSAPSSPYDIAVVGLQDPPLNPVNARFAKQCHPGIVTSNTRDFTAKVTYPHLNFSIPVMVLQPLLELFDQTGNAAVFKVLDAAENDVTHVWRLLQSKL